MAPQNGNITSTKKEVAAPPFSTSAPILEKMKHGYDPMIEGVRWSERYAERLERMWAKLPGFVGRTLAATAILMLGSSVQGDSYGVGGNNTVFFILLK